VSTKIYITNRGVWGSDFVRRTLKSMPKLSSQLRIEMTANDGVNMVKTEVKKQDSASVKWNGPRTAEGKQRIAQAQLKHGFYSKVGLAAKHSESIQLRQLEDIAYLTGLIQGPRTRGAKPRGYKAIRSMAAVKAVVALE
jgi:hypothetical protein